jgi:hypothetical protein
VTLLTAHSTTCDTVEQPQPSTTSEGWAIRGLQLGTRCMMCDTVTATQSPTQAHRARQRVEKVADSLPALPSWCCCCTKVLDAHCTWNTCLPS